MHEGFIERNDNTTPSQENTSHSHELTDTTHYSILDNKGNAIAVTYTLNGFFGARVMARHTGFFLNNEMDDFTVKSGIENKFGLVQSHNNFIAPGKRPLSSMTPTIVMKNGHVVMIIGSPGGPRIITAVLLTLLNVIDYGRPLQSAADAPRFHYQGIPDSVDLEPLALSLDTINQLKKLGYHFTPQHTWAAIEAIHIDPTTGNVDGANDVRRPDGAALYGN
jgi:gamma-glutamyltranspeptidase/glutathione hydrolase